MEKGFYIERSVTQTRARVIKSRHSNQTWAAIGERGPLIPLVPLISAHNGNGSGSVRAGRGAVV